MGMDRVCHRGRWEGQPFANSFESVSKSYKTALECDVILLADGNLFIGHPRDFGKTDVEIESLALADLKIMNIPGKTDEDPANAIPLFQEYLASSYDRGLEMMFEIKGSDAAMAKKTARRIVEEIAAMRRAGAFHDEREFSGIIPAMTLHSISPDAITEAKKVMEEKNVKMNLGLTWLSDAERAKENSMTKDSIVDITAEAIKAAGGWEPAGVNAAALMGCNSIWFIEPAKITQELVDQAHGRGLKIHAAMVSSEAEAEKLLQMGVDKVMGK